MQQNYYKPKNLKYLKAAHPDLHSRLEYLSFRIHDRWQGLTSSPAMAATDRILILLDLIDLVDDFMTICKKVKAVYVKETGKPFFYLIEEYHLRRTQLLIALAMYDDLFP
ncbi:hypothetical protein ADH76_02135 [Enterocloster clostridioformis]|uniref:hypothetical protein n=1 Tax=Enterocloster clostridioformis TaxID=1531 RepID=UPI00080C5C41|nr:hypothetical protein [Enterocloster clostridioformis]ANU44814.1 hypothetical protein A4V08_02280 [Lachnoclostridium sp. YL32]NDO27818.1 hypothetical protein [Enterocloster clostridioformis]OXE70279.1 hypothetical protein ADH76_02135 [Enterocloster clostridioformis]QQR00425.1 hypothetical protein I5Q83_32385 [Enterocloster clostridioformis]